MKNRFLRIMLSLSVLSNGLVATQCNISAEEFTEGDYIYTVENGEAVIYDVNDGLSGEVVIPDTIGGYTVGKIGMNAFSYTEITKIVIPDSVSVIENDAFYGCYNLNEVTMPSELVTIGKGAFAMCSSLTDIYIPSGVTSIGEDIFLACDSMIGITVDENNPSYSSQDGVLFNKDKTILYKYPASKTEVRPCRNHRRTTVQIIWLVTSRILDGSKNHRPFPFRRSPTAPPG